MGATVFRLRLSNVEIRYMKRLYSLLLFCLVFSCFWGCKKTKEEKAIRNTIVGTWELRRASGQITINYAPGNGNRLKFTKSAYERAANGQLAENGTYKIVRDNSVEKNVCLVMADGQFENRIDFSKDNNNRKVFLQLSGDTLHLVSGCFANDSGSFTDYVRLQDSMATAP